MGKKQLFIIAGLLSLTISGCSNVVESLNKIDLKDIVNINTSSSSVNAEPFVVLGVTAGESYDSVASKFSLQKGNNKTTRSVQELDSFSAEITFKFSPNEQKLCGLSYQVKERNKNEEEFTTLMRRIIAKNNQRFGEPGVGQGAMNSKTYEWRPNESNGVYKSEVTWYQIANYIMSTRIAPYAVVDYQFYNFRDCL